MLKALFVMCAAAGLDWIWAKYTIAVSERQAMRAGLLSAVIFGLGGSIVTAYVSDPMMLIPAAVGAFFGTYAATRK